jgi:hypothetical protein
LVTGSKFFIANSSSHEKEMGYTMDGERSALRIRSADTQRFAVRSAGGPMMDPSGADVFILIPSARLAPGEYGFMNKMQMNGNGGGTNMSYTFYTFGIDP